MVLKCRGRYSWGLKTLQPSPVCLSLLIVVPEPSAIAVFPLPPLLCHHRLWNTLKPQGPDKAIFWYIALGILFYLSKLKLTHSEHDLSIHWFPGWIQRCLIRVHSPHVDQLVFSKISGLMLNVSTLARSTTGTWDPLQGWIYSLLYCRFKKTT